MDCGLSVGGVQRLGEGREVGKGGKDYRGNSFQPILPFGKCPLSIVYIIKIIVF